jgi:hypothetical protein
MTKPTSDEQATIEQVLHVNKRLLSSIADGDWKTYAELCDPNITAFEPEARGQLVEGMDFHRFYFDQGGIAGAHNTTMCSPHVRRGRRFLCAAGAAHRRCGQVHYRSRRRDARVASHGKYVATRAFSQVGERVRGIRDWR